MIPISLIPLKTTDFILSFLHFIFVLSTQSVNPDSLKHLYTHTHTHQTTETKLMEYVKKTQEPTERAPKGQGWNNLSNQINKLVLGYNLKYKINTYRASLVAQWLRICLLMQGTRVRALVWEDPTCHGAAGPVSHNY